MLQLREMTETEFTEYRPFIIEEYAKELSDYFDFPIDSARAMSNKSVESLLPQGLASPNQFLYIILFSEGDAELKLGYLWLEIDGINQRCFIYDFYLQEAHRGQGWGRKTLELLETRMAGRGIDRIGLNVFYENTVARELYTRLGYQVVSQNMQKRLGG